MLALALCAAIICFLGIATSLNQTSKNLLNSGSVKGISAGIYWDSACTNATSSINWGFLDPGSTKILKVFVRNEGNSPATLPKMLGNWTPSNASAYISVNWNYSGKILHVDQVIPVDLMLVVSSTISGITSFGFDMTITATG